MKKTLVDGYPALADGTMLDYLFKEGDAVDKLNTTSIDGLFQRNEITGAYTFNSRTNHAEYTDNFFQLYDEIITPNFITYPFGNFLPLNKIETSKATQVEAFNREGGVADYIERTIDDLENNKEGLDSYWKDTQNQLVTMLEEYKENWQVYPRTINGGYSTWTTLRPGNAIRDYFFGDADGKGDSPSDDDDFITVDHLSRMYNIDWDVQTNFFFGMEMKMNFMMPKGGITGPNNDQNMEFYFTGDDDVWVYIDDVLFLDLSGIHRHVGGYIDFVNGVVKYEYLDTANTGDVSKDTVYKTYTFAEILSAAGKDTSVLNSKGTFADYTTHSFNFYYTERGSGSSVCRINFNFPLLHKNSITVSKVNAPDSENVELAGNPDYYFNIVTPDNELFVGPGSVTGVTTYTVRDAAGNPIKNDDGTVKTFTTDQYGIFTLKAGQTAVFEGIEENEGEFFVQELIKVEDNEQYIDVTVNDVDARYQQVIDWSYRTYFTDTDNDNETGPYGYKWYGYSGQDTDSSTNSSFYFEQKNGVVTANLGTLSIAKILTEGDPDPNKKFKMYVELDGAPLPVGTSYTVGTETRTVEEAGYIELKGGETALIKNILSGTEFHVYETSESAEGYEVSYISYNADEATVDNDDGTGVKGVIRAQTSVRVEITNSRFGDLSVTKQVNGVQDETEFAFTIKLTGDADTLPGDYTAVTTKDGVEVTPTSNPTTVGILAPTVGEGETAPEPVTLEITGIKLKHGETFTIKGLPLGTTWTVTEVLTEEQTGVYAPSYTYGEITEDGNTVTGVLEAGGAAVTVTNTQLFELPLTGGPGTHLYTLGGLLLIAASLLLYSLKLRRKEGKSWIG